MMHLSIFALMSTSQSFIVLCELVWWLVSVEFVLIGPTLWLLVTVTDIFTLLFPTLHLLVFHSKAFTTWISRFLRPKRLVLIGRKVWILSIVGRRISASYPASNKSSSTTATLLTIVFHCSRTLRWKCTLRNLNALIFLDSTPYFSNSRLIHHQTTRCWATSLCI